MAIDDLSSHIFLGNKMEQNNRILILGGSHSEIPLIHAARRRGLAIITSGNRPEHPGHALSNKYIPADFSDPDAIIDVIKSSKCGYIVSAANDYAYLTACKVANKLNLPGFDQVEIAETLHHKHLFKSFAKSIGIPITSFTVVDSKTANEESIIGLKYPLMVKAVDLTGGKGISTIATASELKPAIKYSNELSKLSSIVIEEYFDGTLHSYSTIIKDGKIVFEYADNEHCYPTPYLVSTSTSIASVPLNILQDLKESTECVAQKLNLVDGVLHCQFLYRNGEYKILEYTRRCSGDLYSSVVQLVTGLCHADQFIRQSLGLDVSLEYSKPVSPFVSRHCIFPGSSGKFKKIDVSGDLKKNVNSIEHAFPKDYLFSEPMKEKAGVVILTYDQQATMLTRAKELNSLVKCTLE